MTRNKLSKVIPIIVLISYFMMIVTNSLANILPINGRGTGEVSDSYPNLFAPAGITFAIWGVIYLLLLVYTMYQLLRYKNASDTKKQLFYKIGILFSLSSVANTVWIFAWHYEVIWLSLILMLVILICLIKINLILKNSVFSKPETVAIKLPFTVYFGWITVATIANVTTFLVSINWTRFSLSEVFWTDLIIGIGAIIGFAGVLYYKSYAYGVVLIWAYFGIAYKHFSPDQFHATYPSVIITVLISIVFLILSLLLLLRVNRKDMLKSK